MHGWQGKILVVDLTKETITKKPLDPQVADTIPRRPGPQFQNPF